ncbi:MAG: hypothetical protein HQM06_13980 [Magnetococcales bacterium]|nr:hypothetical protein [Magnetococcales bacterium]
MSTDSLGVLFSNHGSTPLPEVDDVIHANSADDNLVVILDGESQVTVEATTDDTILVEIQDDLILAEVSDDVIILDATVVVQPTPSFIYPLSISKDLLVENPCNKAYPLVVSAMFPFTIKSIAGLAVANGACTVSVTVNGDPVSGLAGLPATSLPVAHLAEGGKMVSPGDNVSLVVSSADLAVDLSLTLHAVRTGA